MSPLLALAFVTLLLAGCSSSTEVDCALGRAKVSALYGDTAKALTDAAMQRMVECSRRAPGTAP